MPTMADVAARAGVSVATVSRALSGDRKSVSAPVLQRVLEAAEELSYTPNNLARNMRAGTENLYGIVGFAKALEMSTVNYEEDSAYIGTLKYYMMDALKKHIPGVSFNGDALGRSLYTVLSVSFPKTERSEMILFNLDINNICASGGSACTSGADQGSHVIRAINNNPNQITVRFSFSKHNTKAEVDAVVEKLKELV